MGIFPKRLESVREGAADMEETVRGLLVRHKSSFLAAQLLVFLSPLASFLQPAIFFWFLRSAGGSGPQPGVAQLASFFVLVELLFMLPTTPAGLGIYEGGIIGIFHLHGWSVPDGAAYAILMRLDDVLFSVAGALLLARFGLRESKEGGQCLNHFPAPHSDWSTPWTGTMSSDRAASGREHRLFW